ncbi:MAG: polysaccharide biosynthesis protein [Thiothrix sp.]|nr:MAG: polysaccharide biosynthesis protein [Thiothrix sp.]
MTSSLFNLPRWKKRAIIILLDLILIPLAVWSSFALRLGTWQPPLNDGIWMLFLAPLVTIPIFIRLGLYRAVIRFIGGQQAVVSVLKGVTLSTLILASVAIITSWQGIPRSVFLIYWGTAFLFIGGSRYLVRLLYTYRYLHIEKNHVIIYGAGSSGIQLAQALAGNQEYRVVAYLDDNPSLHKAIIQGLQVYKSEQLPHLVEKLNINQLFMAMPSLSKARKSEILQSLEPLPIHILTVPSMSELISGERKIDELREIEVDELLGRDSVSPDQELLTACITGQTVMITGAGGSIGSELCRQALKLAPSKLLLFEASEFALYSIDSELNKLLATEQPQLPKSILVPVLGSVQNQTRLEEVIQQYQVHTVYHAAAYKHVPLVEHNPIEGIRNNTFGTLYTALAAKNCNVRNFVFISTDKAVRPTNVMGASKRMAELTLQALAEQPSRTLFSMVRFGNVLGSSGSVVPLFRKQIQMGGPITITHPEIIRYFMTIPEAAQLVIQAGALAKGGEVFLLDMGEPVKIIDLARRMVHLSGYTIKDSQNPDGQIELKFTGLRPGEKLYEELLIDSKADKTTHPKVFKAHENYLPWADLEPVLAKLEKACQQRDAQQIQSILESYVSGFKGHVQVETIPVPIQTSKKSANLAFFTAR